MMSALEIEFLKFAMDGAFICSNSTCVVLLTLFGLLPSIMQKIHKMIRNMMCQNSGSMWFAKII